jgi:DNA-binding NarL/FixJ family response regulator
LTASKGKIKINTEKMTKKNEKVNSKSRGRILVVDDDPKVLGSSRLWLSTEGFQVFTSSNHQQAIQVADAEEIEVALVDFRLGFETGLDVAKSLHEVDDAIKVVIITGYPNYDTAVEAMKIGVFDYLSKGSSNAEVLAKVEKALAARKQELIKAGRYEVKTDISKCAIICSHSLITERLKVFCSNNPEFRLIKIFGSFEDFLEEKFLPEINNILICGSCCLGEEDDHIKFFRQLYRALPVSKPIIINERFSDQKKIELLKMGVKGFFPIDMDSEKLVKGLMLINQGDIWADRRLIGQALQSGVEYLDQQTKNFDSNPYDLTDREKEILKIMVLGLKNKQIADKLFISEMTVKTHINKIFKKLKVKNRIQAVLIALDKKLI